MPLRAPMLALSLQAFCVNAEEPPDRPVRTEAAGADAILSNEHATKGTQRHPGAVADPECEDDARRARQSCFLNGVKSAAKN